MKTTITVGERLQLIGLLALADRHYRILEEVREAITELVGGTPEDGEGHISDAIYDGGRRDADQLLKRLGITVGKAK